MQHIISSQIVNIILINKKKRRLISFVKNIQGSQHLHFYSPFFLTYQDEISNRVSYSEVCTRDSVNGNTVALTVMIIARETRNSRMATLNFSLRKMFSSCETYLALERNLYSPKRVYYARAKTVLQYTRQKNAYYRDKTPITHDNTNQTFCK